MILGWGVRLAGAGREALRLVERLGIPTLLTWPALDLIPSDHPCAVGAFGTHGTRHANFTVQNADLAVQLSPERFRPLVERGALSLGAYARAHAAWERFRASGGRVMLLGFVVSGRA